MKSCWPARDLGGFQGNFWLKEVSGQASCSSIALPSPIDIALPDLGQKCGRSVFWWQSNVRVLSGPDPFHRFKSQEDAKAREGRLPVPTHYGDTPALEIGIVGWNEGSMDPTHEIGQN